MTSKPKWYSREANKPLPDTDYLKDINGFDWMNTSNLNGDYNFSILKTNSNMFNDDCHTFRVLEPVSKGCRACTMCELGQSAIKDEHNNLRDPHVFSSLTDSKYVIIGMSPSVEDAKNGNVFSDNIGNYIIKHLNASGVARDDLYITNLVKCVSDAPELHNRRSCEPYLNIELNTINPRVIATIGEDVFHQFCPHVDYRKSFKTIIKNNKYGFPVLPVESPLVDRDVFKEHIAIFSKIIKSLSRN